MVYKFGSAFITGVVLIAAKSNVLAANWEIVPEAQAKVIYTDNVLLGTANAEQSEIIHELRPGVTINADGAHASLDFSYYLQALYYQGLSERNDVYHQLDMDLNTELINRFAFFDLAANYDQQITNSRAGTNSNNALISGNRTNTASFQLSPYLRNTFQRNRSFLVRPSYGEVRYDDSLYDDSKISQVIASVDQQSLQTSMGWRMSAQQRAVKYQNEDELLLRRLDYGISLPLSLRVLWTIDGGREQNRYSPSIDTPDVLDDTVYIIWSTGLQWEPGERTSVSGSFGKRYFGNTYNFLFNHRSKYTVWRVEYLEDIETSSLQLQPIRSTEQANQGAGLPRFQGVQNISNQPFVSRRFTISINGSRGKSDYAIHLFKVNREYQLGENDDRMRGATLSYTWRMYQRTRVIGSVDYQKYKFSIDNSENTVENYAITLVRTLGPDTTVELEYNYGKNDSNADNFGYRYNMVSANINARF